MKPAIATTLVLSACVCSSLAHAQNATPPAAKASSFEADSRPSVRAFADGLNRLSADCQKLKADNAKSDSDKAAKAAEDIVEQDGKAVEKDNAEIKQDLSELRFSGNERTATSMLNPGMAIALYSAALSGLPSQLANPQSNSAGSTSLVTKAGGASLLGLAIDTGALTSSVSGATTTLSGNLEGIGSLLTGKAPISIDPTSQNTLRKIAGDVNLQATFALAQPSSVTTTATQPITGTTPPAGTKITIPSSVGKLTGITAQFTVHNPFNPHSPSFRKNWTAAFTDLKGSVDSMLKANSPVVDALECAACQQDWVDAKTALTQAATEGSQESMASIFDRYVSTVLAHARAADKNFDTEFIGAVKATAAYQKIEKEAVDKALGSLFTVEYSYGKPASKPETHDFKLVYGYAMSSTSAINSLLAPKNDGKSLFTANANISIYGGALPASAKYGRLHYGQVSAEFDRPVLGATVAKQAVFSLAGYWQYQPSPSVLTITQGNVAPGTSIPAPTQVLVGTAGSLWVAQAKMTINNGKSGISVPFGVKWSNKTDLLSGNKIGAQVGISYDFSSLSSLLGGGN